jgi:large subunit ribosomal protein L32
MAVPKKRLSRTRRDTRRSHHALKITNPSKCENCQAFKLQHHVCKSCGTYRGRTMIKIKEQKAQV